MTSSYLTSYTRISPNSSARTQKICKFTPHYMAGNLSIETCANVFAPTSRQASSNYGIGSDGRVGMYVDENRRAWTSSSAWNDQRAITVEVANIDANGTITQEAWNSLVLLAVDVCKRYGFRLNWTGDKNGSLTCHYMYSATSCPGNYLKARMGELARQVNDILDGKATAPSAPAGSGSGSSNSGSGNKVPAGNSGFKGGVYVVNVDTLNVRDYPSTSGNVVAAYKRGQTVILDSWYVVSNGYVWGRYTGGSGNKRYIAVGKHTGKAEGDDYLILQGTTPASSKPSIPQIEVDGWWGPATTRSLQRALGTTQDSIISGQDNGNFRTINRGGLQKNTWKIGRGGSLVIKAMQRKIGTNADGYCGPNTIKALQGYLGTYVDGKVDGPSNMVKALQRRLNAGTF